MKHCRMPLFYLAPVCLFSTGYNFYYNCRNNNYFTFRNTTTIHHSVSGKLFNAYKEIIRVNRHAHNRILLKSDFIIFVAKRRSVWLFVFQIFLSFCDIIKRWNKVTMGATNFSFSTSVEEDYQSSSTLTIYKHMKITCVVIEYILHN